MGKNSEDNPFIRFILNDMTNGKTFYNLCTKVIANKYGIMPQDREDVFQIFSLKMISLHPNYDSKKGREKQYLSKVFTNECSNFLAEKARNRVQNFTSLYTRYEEFLPVKLESDKPTPLEILTKKEGIQKLHNAIQELPQTKREMVRLRTMGMSYEEIARYLQIPKNTAINRFHKSIKILEGILSRHTQ